MTPATASELRLSAHASQLRIARAYAHRVAAGFGLDEEGCSEFVFAVNEAVTNAIRHGLPDGDGAIHLSVRADGRRLTLSVRDYGTFAASPHPPAPDSEGGRGFAFMSDVLDGVQLCVAPGSTTVRLSKELV